jgi:tetratricopeptide (TPR) repeat protein
MPRAPALLALVLLTVARAGWADEAAAKKAFLRGVAAGQRHDYRAAAVAFEEAFKEAPRAAAKYNAALAWNAADEPAHAADAFQEALAFGGLDAADAKDAERKLSVLDKALGRIEVSGPKGATVSVDGSEPQPVPLHAHVAAGKHTVVANLDDGHKVEREVVIGTGAREQVRIPESGDRAPTVAGSEAAPPPTSTAKRVGFVLLGASAASIGTAIGLGVATLGARDRYNNGGDKSASDRSSAVSLEAATNVFWVTAAVTGAVGGVLLFTAKSSTSAAPSASVRLVPGPFGASLHGRF